MEDWRSFLPEAGEKISPLPRFLTGSYFHPLDAQHPSLPYPSRCHYNAPLLRKSPPKSGSPLWLVPSSAPARSMDLEEERVVVLASAAISEGERGGG